MEGNGGQHNLERVAAALEAAGASLQCPSCGRFDWSRDPDPVVLPSARPEGNLVPAIPAFILICDNCGFVRLHSLKALLKENN